MRSAFYEKEITPPLGCSMPGYFTLREASGVLDKLYAKAAVFEQEGEVSAMVVLDTTSLILKTCDAVRERVGQFTGIKPENIMICANHSHTGGPRGTEHELYEVTGVNKESNEEYLKILPKLLADSIILAYQRLDDASLKFGVGNVNSISFNRNYIMKNGTIRTNPGMLNPDIVRPHTEIDPELSVMLVENGEGVPKGAIISFACHQDCVGGTKFSGDFSSILSKELKERYGEDFISIFVPGTCGNINHVDVTKGTIEPGHYVKMGKILAEEAILAINSAKPVKNDKLSVKKQDITVKKRIPTDVKVEEAKKTMDELSIKKERSMQEQVDYVMARRLVEYSNSPEKEFHLSVQVLRIGDVAVYALPCEIFVQFGLRLKDESPTKHNIVATLCNGYAGYIPVPELMSSPAYEARVGVSSRFAPETGDMLVDASVEFAKELWK